MSDLSQIWALLLKSQNQIENDWKTRAAQAQAQPNQSSTGGLQNFINILKQTQSPPGSIKTASLPETGFNGSVAGSSITKAQAAMLPRSQFNGAVGGQSFGNKLGMALFPQTMGTLGKGGMTNG